MQYKLSVDSISIEKQEMVLGISGEFSDPSFDAESLSTPKVILYFENEKEDRRIPFVIRVKNITRVDGKIMFTGEYTYYLNFIFWKTRMLNMPFRMYFNVSCAGFYKEKVPVKIEPELFEQDNLYYSAQIEDDHINFTVHPKPIKKDVKRRKFVVLFDSILKKIAFIFAIPLIPVYIVMGLLTFTGYIKMPKRIQAENKLVRLASYVLYRVSTVCRENFSKVRYKRRAIRRAYKRRRRHKIVENRITFYSCRRNEVSGNFEFVYNKLKEHKDLDIQFLFNTNTFRFMTKEQINDFAEACATSKVIVLDEYTPQIHLLDLKPETKIVQLWHACGAFKTFGFTRLGKPKGSPQKTRMHRSYDYVTVSSEYCKKCHSEGFGIATDNVIPTGIARTDILFDKEYKANFVNKFYSEYPNLKDKKIILFAPTFRGNVKESAHYPVDLFDIDKICKRLGDDYAIIIKHHPFVQDEHYIPEKYKDRVIDLSENSEINDLLFISDVIITDYSSLVFEASLLEVPMLFYVFDLKSYINGRDFYFDFESNIPGKICKSEEELITAIQEGDFEAEKIPAFRDMFFDNLDGNSSQRIADLIYSCVEKKE